MGDRSLSQPGFFESREFEITESGISVSIRGLFFRNRYTVPFEHLIREPVEFTLSSPNWRWLGVGCLVLSALFLFVTVVEEKGAEGAWVSFAFFMGALGCMLGYRLTMRTFLRISESAMNVDIAQTQPSKEQVDAFIEDVGGRARNYYGEMQHLQPSYDRVGQIERLVFLLDKGVISDEEFQTLKAELVNPLTMAEPTQSGLYL